ncbi:MAG: hypothetical protein NT015_08990 [Alphaproteobacteria bacterium]|nr:hypothetical protein [Alphaproteobacteria bacterium]
MLDPKMRRLATALSFLMLAPMPALAQTTTSPDIVVTGLRPEQAQSFVTQVAIPAPTADQLPRWDNSICTSIAGMPARQGRYLADRIAQRAAAVGLQPGGPNCQANVAIFVTGQSDTFSRQLFERDRDRFAYFAANNVSTLGRGAMDDFLTTPRAVRWWYVSQTFGADGLSLAGDASSGGMSNAPSTRASGTRLTGATRENLSQVIIVIDAQRVRGVQLATLADYVSFIALAQVNPNASTTDYPTIMNVFSGVEANAGAPTSLTLWDTAFLDALYKADRNAINPATQQREIARRMLGANS